MTAQSPAGKVDGVGFTPAEEASVPTAQTDGPAATFQDRCKDWVVECFGDHGLRDVDHRNRRFLEEAGELVQSAGMPEDEALAVIRYAFSRPAGDVHQEVGGVMMTLAAHCTATGHDMTAEGERELARVWTKVEAIRAKEAAKPDFRLASAEPDRAEGGEGDLQSTINEMVGLLAPDQGYGLTAEGRRLFGLASRAQSLAASLTPGTTDDLVDRFAAALKDKLRAAEAKYGYNDGWLRDDWQSDLIANLSEHVRKGDPRDVAAYCAFAWHHGWSVSPPTPAVEGEPSDAAKLAAYEDAHAVAVELGYPSLTEALEALSSPSQEQAGAMAKPFMWAYQSVDDGRWQAFSYQLRRADGSVCPGRALYAHPQQQGAVEVARKALDWSEYEDDLSDVIQDSIDTDWTSRDGAKAVVHWLSERGE